MSDGATIRPEEQFGSPLVDAELVDLRWSQRRILRELPDWLVRNVTSTGFVRAPGVQRAPVQRDRIITEDRFLVERHLRAVAGEQIARVRAVIDEMREATSANALRSFYNKWGTAGIEPLNTAHKDSVGSEGGKRFGTPTGDGVDELLRDEAAVESVRAIVTSLTWADVLAGDGYSDERIRANP
jgi:hypothetical protein